MPSAEVIIMEIVCPALGMVIATMMFFAPYRDLQHAIERGHLGTLNPTPWVFMFGNCLGWVVYSILSRNFWLFFSNCPGLILSVWLNLGAVKLLYQGHFSTEMRKSFAAYLEHEAVKDEEKPAVSAPSKTIDEPQRSLGDILNEIFVGDDGSDVTNPVSDDGGRGTTMTAPVMAPVAASTDAPTTMPLPLSAPLPMMAPSTAATATTAATTATTMHATAPCPLPDDELHLDRRDNAEGKDEDQEKDEGTHKRTISENVADAVAEIFSGPVYGPGHKRTLSMEVAAEAFIGGAVVENPGAINTTTATTDHPAQQRRPSFERAPSESVFGAIENVTDFARLVWNVTAQTTPAPAPHEKLVMWNVILWVGVLCLVFFAQKINEDTSILIVGSFTNLNLIFFYGAPLSTIVTVMSEGNSNSIHVPTMITNTMSSSFWMVYGLAIADWFVAAPNGLGTLLGAAQIFLFLSYPRTIGKWRKNEQPSSGNNPHHGRPLLQRRPSIHLEDSITDAEKKIRAIETPIIPSPPGFVKPDTVGTGVGRRFHGTTIPEHEAIVPV